tara:strand:+ start:1210 stop:1713 length:504 start_codon:yes stop_codon:yes gene_type:complete
METNHIVIECPLCGERGLHVMGTKASEETRQCLNCGYVTAPKFKCENVEENSEYKNLTPEMQEWAKHEGGFIWIPTIMTLPFGILYPFNDDKKMKWGFAEMVDIPEDEQKNYPIEGGEGFYKQRYDMENSTTFESFLLGMNYVNDTVKQKQQATNQTELPKLKLDDE